MSNNTTRTLQSINAHYQEENGTMSNKIWFIEFLKTTFELLLTFIIMGAIVVYLLISLPVLMVAELSILIATVLYNYMIIRL